MRPADRPRSAASITLGTFLVLAALALGLVLAAGDRAPLWLIGSWFLIALALALTVGALVPADTAPSPGETEGEGTDDDGPSGRR
ncbi:MAG: hypothetical protein Q4G40_01675 [Brachybacterium sp.]|nr:hypothetical protein [Brachybacterium sp.]